MGAIHGLKKGAWTDARTVDLDTSALVGSAYTRAKGYIGPGQGLGEGILALVAYGTLGEPSEEGRDAAARIARCLGDGAPAPAVFLSAIDETCKSDRPARWMELLRGSEALHDVRIGETCGSEPSSLAASLVMQTASDLDPARGRLARERGKWVWAYNGKRPAAGPMMLDVPATDLRANAWIAVRYGIPRWFYWVGESGSTTTPAAEAAL